MRTFTIESVGSTLRWLQGYIQPGRYARLIAMLFSAIVVAQVHSQTSAPSESEYSADRVTTVVSEATYHGDWRRGVQVFTRSNLACFSCHKIGDAGGQIGPNLTEVGKNRTAEEITESLFWPNRKIVPEYQAYKILTDDGDIVVGYLESKEDAATVVVRDPSSLKVTSFRRSEIQSIAKSSSLMPAGLFDALPAADQADLVKFLSSLGKGNEIDLPAVEAQVRAANTHQPATFPLTHPPLHPDYRTAWQEHVNRDRIFDFYSKQASYFAKQSTRPTWIEAYPGLDGPGFGQWGNQNEHTWKGDEWNHVNLGSVQCNVLVGVEKPVPRAVAFRMGDRQEWSAVFNPDTLGYELLWRDGFLKFSDVRHGYMDGFRAAGKVYPLPENGRPLHFKDPNGNPVPVHYRGYYRNGASIVFSYDVNGVEMLDSVRMTGNMFDRKVAQVAQHPMRNAIQGGKPQWPQVIETRIVRGVSDGYTVDTIELPTKNPWNAPIACGDHAFLSDGSAVVVTMHGDVWRVSGLQSDKAKWRRIASGMHHLLGVVVHEDSIYTLGRNQITRLHDLNGDQEIDFYECFSKAFVTSPSGHDYICGLVRDKHGYFYTASGNQGIVRISPDGQQAEVIATGFRNPDGLGILDDATLTVPASEGEWTATSAISLVAPKEVQSDEKAAVFETTDPPFYGYRGPREGQKVMLPLLYLPRGLDNSAGGQTIIHDPRMGPIDGQIVHTSFGAATCMTILRDQVQGQWQGAAVPLPVEFRSGSHRVHLNPGDGQLYVTGMNGWGTYTSDAGCFQRVRYTGSPVQRPVGFHVHENGISVTFSEPIDATVASNAANHFVQCWNYRYSPGYGSQEFSVLHHPMIGHDVLNIQSAHALEDGKTLFLEIQDMQLCSQLHVWMQIGDKDPSELYATVNAMDKSFDRIESIKIAKSESKLPHPLARDLEWLKRSIPNPWRGRLDGARALAIEARDNLQFSTRILEAKPGERIKLTFTNPDVVPHNWALLKPGTLEKVGEMANHLISDPDAYLRHYVPESDSVICYTDVVEPKSEFVIFFQAPDTPGRYPYLCTFPGHWMVMNGELVVKK